MKKVGIIGLGLIGKERLKAIKLLHDCERDIVITGLYDPYSKEADHLAKEFKTKAYNNLESLIDIKPDWFFVAIPHDLVVEVVPKLLKTDSKVLVEKPLGRTVKEAAKLINLTKYPDQLYVGFNYRYYDCISLALKDINEKRFGKLISIDIVLGHGGSPELKNNWKLDPVRAGGGCILDPGVHLLDLCRIISNGKIKPVSGLSWKGFWKTGIEEEAHILLRCEGFIINLQVSIVRWRSTFIMAIRGEDGYGIVSGRGRYYGRQSYVRGKRWGWLGGVTQRDSEELILGSAVDDSFVKELNALFFPNSHEYLKPCLAQESLETMKLWEECIKVVKEI